MEITKEQMEKWIIGNVNFASKEACIFQLLYLFCGTLFFGIVLLSTTLITLAVRVYGLFSIPWETTKIMLPWLLQALGFYLAFLFFKYVAIESSKRKKEAEADLKLL